MQGLSVAAVRSVCNRPSVTIVGHPGIPGRIKVCRSDRSPARTPSAASVNVIHRIETDNPSWLANELRRRCRHWCPDAEWLAPPPRTLQDLRLLKRWNKGQKPEFVA
jgi:hypothetical protein